MQLEQENNVVREIKDGALQKMEQNDTEHGMETTRKDLKSLLKNCVQEYGEARGYVEKIS